MASTEDPILQVSGLTKSFGALKVLRGIDLTVRNGEVVAVIGASGSGKSTMLRCINYLEIPTAGTVRFRGKQTSLDELDSLRTQIGMVFQRFNLFPHLTALENVTVAPIRVRNVAPDAARREGIEMLERVHLQDKANVYPAQLSGGQQQRVAIARALALKPALMLFDEPTSALDPELVGEVLAVIRDLAAEGRTMIIATHEMGFCRDVASRVLFLDAGLILEEGKPEELFSNPREPRTREFLARVLSR